MHRIGKAMKLSSRYGKALPGKAKQLALREVSECSNIGRFVDRSEFGWVTAKVAIRGHMITSFHYMGKSQPQKKKNSPSLSAPKTRVWVKGVEVRESIHRVGPDLFFRGRLHIEGVETRALNQQGCRK